MAFNNVVYSEALQSLPQTYRSHSNRGDRSFNTFLLNTCCYDVVSDIGCSQNSRSYLHVCMYIVRNLFLEEFQPYHQQAHTCYSIGNSYRNFNGLKQFV